MPEQKLRRREAIALLGGITVFPSLSRAQRADRIRRIGILTGFTAADLEGRSLLAVFRQRLEALGWSEGRNLSVEIRWGDAADPERLRDYSAELVRMELDVIVVHGSRSLAAVRRATDRIPIVFASVADPVASGYVESLARPGGNVTGVTIYTGMPSPKLLELLKEVAPALSHVAIAITPDNLGVERQVRALEEGARTLGLKSTALLIRDPERIAPEIKTFAQEPNGGLVVSSDVFMITHRDAIIAAAARHRLLTVYQDRSFVAAGGLLSYGVDRRDRYRRVAVYVDRILRGANPGELPIQQPANYELVINLGTAKQLGVEVPRVLLVRADEVIN